MIAPMNGYAEIEEFRQYVQENLVKGIACDGAPHSKFLPHRKLEEHFTEDNHRRLKRLVHKCCPPDSQTAPGHIVEVIVNNKFMIVFATLLLISEGPLIILFIDKDNLSDSHLPFTGNAPKQFPPTSVHDGLTNVYEKFQRQQWIFLPAHIESRAKQLEPEHILPIIDTESLEVGGSAETSKIIVHPDYNRLRHAAGDECAENHVFVMKRFLPLHANEYRQEKSVFLHLRGQHQSLIHSLVKWHGCFEQVDINNQRFFSIILEYANGGDLERLFQDQEPPRQPDDIACFWIQIMDILKALRALHTIRIDHPDREKFLNGWHQDVKPQNILIRKREGKELYKGEYKLADLGLAHVRPRVGPQTSTYVAQGTKTYGAPECYSQDVFSMGLHRSVHPLVDIWSFGCVLSEAMVWLVGGKDALNTYRRDRHDKTEAISGHQDKCAFHDGHDRVLPCVLDRHDALKHEIRTGDNFTPHVLELVRRCLLVPGEARSSAAAAYHQWEDSKRQAQKLVRGQSTIASSNITSCCTQPPASVVAATVTSEPRSMGSITSRPTIEEGENALGIFDRDAQSSPPTASTPQQYSKSPVSSESLINKPPTWAVATARRWLLTRRSKRGEKQKLGVPNTAFRDELKGRDHVFLIDDSFKMQKYWGEAADIVELLSEILFALRSDDEIDIELISGDDKCCEDNSKALKDFVEGHYPPDGEDRVLNLEYYIDQYMQRYFQRLRKTKLRAAITNTKGRKPLNLYILTDGCYQKKSDVERPIRRTIDTLDELEKDEYFVGLQFIQFGNNMEGSRRLADLDTFARGAGLSRDIVDTELASGNVWKMLLGAINETFDDDPQEKQSQYQQLTPASMGAQSMDTESSLPPPLKQSTLPYRNKSTKAAPHLKRRSFLPFGKG